MNRELKIKIDPLEDTIDYGDSIVFWGSCFSEHIAKYLSGIKFRVYSNSHGIVYNPASICKSIQDVVLNRSYRIDELEKRRDIWYSWFHHSSFSGMDPEKVIQNINGEIQKTYTWIQKAKYAIITPATSFCYKLKKNGLIVSNNHKLPSEYFDKVLLSTEEVSEYLNRSCILLRQVQPDIKIIFTISPVRHIRDGMIENNNSKSRLIQAVHEICKQHHCIYFPSYEIIMDVLRDYRYYEKDLVHPNKLSLEIVQNYFSEFAFNSSTRKTISSLENIMTGIHHKPFFEESADYQEFKKEMLQKIINFRKENPEINLEQEQNKFS